MITPPSAVLCRGYIIQHRRRPTLFLGRDGNYRDFPAAFHLEQHARDVFNKYEEIPEDWHILPITFVQRGDPIDIPST